MSVIRLGSKKLKIKYLRKKDFSTSCAKNSWFQCFLSLSIRWERWIHGVEYGVYIRRETNLKKKLSILCTAIDGIRTLHERKRPLLHGDISSRNLIVDSHSQQASWIDWDSLAVEDTLEPSESLYSTSSYLAPEKIFLGKNTCLAEVFALGALIYETILGRPLFSHGEKGIEESRYFTESKCLMLRIVPTYGELLVRALHPNPKKRYPSARDLQSQLQTILLKS